MKTEHNGFPLIIFYMLANFDVDSMEPIGCKTFCNQKAIKLYHGVV